MSASCVSKNECMKGEERKKEGKKIEILFMASVLCC